MPFLLCGFNDIPDQILDFRRTMPINEEHGRKRASSPFKYSKIWSGI